MSAAIPLQGFSVHTDPTGESPPHLADSLIFKDEKSSRGGR